MIYMYEPDSLDKISLGVRHEMISDLTFLDNGVAYSTSYGTALMDGKSYYIFNRDILPKINYNLSLADFTPDTLHLHYYKSDGRIYKELYGQLFGIDDGVFDPKEKTQAEYEADKSILESANVMALQVKDFTAENIGL